MGNGVSCNDEMGIKKERVEIRINKPQRYEYSYTLNYADGMSEPHTGSITYDCTNYEIFTVLKALEYIKFLSIPFKCIAIPNLQYNIKFPDNVIFYQK